MEELSPTITSKKSPLFIWFLDSEEVIIIVQKSSQPLLLSLESTSVRRWFAENVTPDSQRTLQTAERKSAVTGVISDQRRSGDEPSWRSMDSPVSFAFKSSSKRSYNDLGFLNGNKLISAHPYGLLWEASTRVCSAKKFLILKINSKYKTNLC